MDGARHRFKFVNRSEYRKPLDDILEPHAFDVTVSVAHGNHVHSYDSSTTIRTVAMHCSGETRLGRQSGSRRRRKAERKGVTTLTTLRAGA